MPILRLFMEAKILSQSMLIHRTPQNATDGKGYSLFIPNSYIILRMEIRKKFTQEIQIEVKKEFS
jgi:hypothetical protein